MWKILKKKEDEPAPEAPIVAMRGQYFKEKQEDCQARDCTGKMSFKEEAVYDDTIVLKCTECSNQVLREI